MKVISRLVMKEGNARLGWSAGGAGMNMGKRDQIRKENNIIGEGLYIFDSGR